MERASLEQAQEHALHALGERQLPQARKWLDQALSLDFEDSTTLNLMKGIGFWEDRNSKLGACINDLDRADALLGHWKAFQAFMDRNGMKDERIIHAFRSFVFGSMLDYLEAYNNPEGIRNPEVLWRVGLCNKMLGRLVPARKFLEAACRIDAQNAAILADLADTLAMLDEDELAKLLFREAFYLSPKDVVLETLESALILRVIENVRAHGLPTPVHAYWIPIIGILTGVFTVTREIKPMEYGRLKQDVYALEREYQDARADRAILMPLLLNKYFWLLDHALQSQQPRHAVNEILLKLESLHPGVYKLYTK